MIPPQLMEVTLPTPRKTKAAWVKIADETASIALPYRTDETFGNMCLNIIYPERALLAFADSTKGHSLIERTIDRMIRAVGAQLSRPITIMTLIRLGRSSAAMIIMNTIAG